MINRVHIQIVDTTLNGMIAGREHFDESLTNQFIAEELQKELNDDYPSMVSVEYVDLYFKDQKDFSGVRDLLLNGDVILPVILFNGIPRLYGGVLPAVIREEVEKILDSGPVH